MKTKIQKPLTIGSLAKASGVGVETVRFYERKGLLKTPPKTGSGFRHYSNEDARKIRFIKRAQDLGFTLTEAKELLEMEVCSKATRPALKKKAEQKMTEVDSKIRDLKRMKESLKQFATACFTQNASIKDCGILECFEDANNCC
jgi:DNA-binding transcriptional MerR regulator